MGNDQRYGGGSSSNNSSSSSSGGGGGGGGKKGKNKSGGGGGGGGGGSGNNSEKPKQPQRGLGVAQLEKIRLQSQMASCGFLPPHPHPHHHHHPLFPSFPPPPPPPPPSFQHLQEDMRMQGGYNHQSGWHSSASFGYSSPAIASSSSFGYPPNFMMGMGDHVERTGNIRYGESQPCTTPRWNPNNNNNNFGPTTESQHYMQPPSMVTRHLLSHVEQNNKPRNGSLETNGGSNSQNSDSSEKEELDLELKL